MSGAIYRKKPLEVEAIKWDGRNIKECEIFVGKDLDVMSGSILLDRGNLKFVNKNDFIIKDGQKFYSCKPDVFEAAYEKVQL